MTTTYPPSSSSPALPSEPFASLSSSSAPPTADLLSSTAPMATAQSHHIGNHQGGDVSSHQNHGQAQIKQQRRSSALSLDHAGDVGDTHSKSTSRTPYRDADEDDDDDEAVTPAAAAFGPGDSAADAPLLRSASQIFRRRPEEIRMMAQPTRIRTREEFWKRGVVVVALILSWYFFSMLISVYNKWMFDPKKRNLPFPIFVTSIHMVVQFSIASSLLAIFDRTNKIKLIPRKPDGRRRRPSSRDWM